MRGMLTLRTTDPAQTGDVGAALLPWLRPGDVLLLTGDLGAGKTAFTQGLARAAGVAEAVTSPTFILVHTYPTSIGLDLVHVDVYRLETAHELADLGLPELIDGDAVAVVEWGERAAALLGPDYLEVAITVDPVEPGVDTPARHVTLRPSGAAWSARWPPVEAALRAALPAPVVEGAAA